MKTQQKTEAELFAAPPIADRPIELARTRVSAHPLDGQDARASEEDDDFNLQLPPNALFVQFRIMSWMSADDPKKIVFNLAQNVPHGDDPVICTDLHDGATKSLVEIAQDVPLYYSDPRNATGQFMVVVYVWCSA